MAESGEVRVEVVRPLKVIACICACVGVVLTVIALATSHWLEADGFHQGVWEYCVDGTTGEAEKCSSATDKLWILVCALLCIVALVSSVIATLLGFVGLVLINRAKLSARRTCFCVAAVFVFIALGCLLAAVILYPIMFIRAINEYRVQFNVSQWFFSWSYGVAWGAAIFFFGAGILYAIGRETHSVIYREKSGRN